MESAEKPSIDEMVEQIKDALINDELHLVKDFPREAFIEAAAHGIEVYEVDKIHRVEKNALNQSALVKYARLGLLDDKERALAHTKASQWLHDNFANNSID